MKHPYINMLKTIKNIDNCRLSIVNLFCIVLLMTSFLSCSEMNELSDRFLDEGEIIYAAKVDSIYPRAGKDRIELVAGIKSQRIEILRVYWKNYTDSLDVKIGGQTGIFPIMLENMPEGGYVFQLVSLDTYGNRSLPMEVTGNSYGEQFQLTLSNRGINSTNYLNEELVINWAGQVDKSIGCNLTYVNKSGNTVELEVPMDEKTTVLKDWKWPTPLHYNTVFLPEPMAIDTFYTESVEIDIQQTFTQRPLTSMDYYEKLILTWPSDPANGVVYYDIEYTTDNGSVKQITVPGNVKTEIADWKWNTSFRYRTKYLSAPGASDPVYTEYIVVSDKINRIDRAQLKIESFSSEHDSGSNAAKNLIDGTNATRWHTKADGRSYPHWVVIDLGSAVSVSQVGVWPTTFEQSAGEIDKRCPTKFQFLVSTDNENWTDLGTFSNNNPKLGEQLYPVTPTVGRYLKFVGLEGTDNNMVVGELSIYLK